MENNPSETFRNRENYNVTIYNKEGYATIQNLFIEIQVTVLVIRLLRQDNEIIYREKYREITMLPFDNSSFIVISYSTRPRARIHHPNAMK